MEKEEICVFCNALKEKSKLLVYEDDKVAAMLSEHPAAPGHLLVFPKEHFTIFEQVPDYVVSHLFIVANKLGIASFEAIPIQGTNMIMQNGISAGQEHAHFFVNMIPRTENDGLNFEWQPKQLTEEEMSTVELQIKEETKNIGAFETEESKPVKVEDKKEEVIDGEENYLVKQLRRIP